MLPILLLSQNDDILDKNNNLPNDVKWVTKSIEYDLLCEQIYRIAWVSIRNRLAEIEYPVIIMDLDETVLDNSEYQFDLFLKSEKYNSNSWNKFVKNEISQLVPGAKEFIEKYKKKPNAKIIYISNRDASSLKATKNNMKKLGIYFDDDIFLLRKDANDVKTIRRQEVVNGTDRMKIYGPQKIIAYFGDASGDFPDDIQYEFGINKFIFPNPMYGEWQ